MAEEIHTEDVALFQRTPVNTAVEEINWVEYKPCYMDKDGLSAVEFSITGNATEYIDLARTELHVRVRLVKDDGTAFGSDESVLPINMILHTMWSGVDVELNKTLVSTSGTNYMYKAGIECLLNYSKEVQRQQMTSIGMVVDETNFDARFLEDNTNAKNVTVGLNPGIASRINMFKNNVAEFVGPLLADICNQERSILNAVDIDITLTPNKDAFRLITSKDGFKCKMLIEDIYLSVCKVIPTPSVMSGHTLGLNTTSGKYPYQKSEVRTVTIPAGYLGETIENIYKGVIPSRLVVGMVDSRAYHGSFGRNPMKFDHFNLESMCLYVNGKPTPKKPFSIDVENNRYLDAMLSVYRATGKLWENIDLCIDRQTWKDGLSLIAFDLDPTSAPDFRYIGKPKFGHTRLDLSFKTALAQPIVLILYATFPARVEIDQARVVTSLEAKDLMQELIFAKTKNPYPATAPEE